MKIPHGKELAIKKAIIKAVESGHSAAKLANGFGVSKSTIYKYRRILRGQGFIKKNENDLYIITANKFSKQSQNIATGELSLEINYEEKNDTALEKVILVEETKEYTSITEIATDKAMEERLQSKIKKMRDHYEKAYEDRGLINKFFGFFKK